MCAHSSWRAVSCRFLVKNFVELVAVGGSLRSQEVIPACAVLCCAVPCRAMPCLRSRFARNHDKSQTSKHSLHDILYTTSHPLCCSHSFCVHAPLFPSLVPYHIAAAGLLNWPGRIRIAHDRHAVRRYIIVFVYLIVACSGRRLFTMSTCILAR